jgi:hypothetical protein
MVENLGLHVPLAPQLLAHFLKLVHYVSLVGFLLEPAIEVFVIAEQARSEARNAAEQPLPEARVVVRAHLRRLKRTTSTITYTAAMM